MIAFKCFTIACLCIILSGIIHFGCEALPEKPSYLAYDPNNPDYVAPQVRILFPPDDEVIAADNVTIEWEGNVPEMTFRYRLNTEPYSAYAPEKTVYFSNLVNGMHYFSIYGRYPTGMISSPQFISFLIWNYTGPGLSLYPDEIRQPRISGLNFQLLVITEGIFYVLYKEMDLLKFLLKQRILKK